jgi:peptidoglycan/xylan/chitin deacetylase (PgdA/CDA1 family)
MFRSINNLKWRFNDLLYITGIRTLPRIPPPVARILLYHGIDEVGSTAYNTKFISQDNFENQIRYLSEHGRIVSLKDFFKGNFDKNKLTTCITFDDGFRNNLTRALPILEKYKAPATIFVTGINSLGETVLWPDFIDLATPELPSEISCAGRIFQKTSRGEFYSQSSNESLKRFLRFKDKKFISATLEELRGKYKISLDAYHPDYYKLLSDDEIYSLANHSLITVGVHGLYHTDWAQMGREECLAELQSCKGMLSRISKSEVSAVAFPFGSYNQMVLECCLESGFTEILSVERLEGIQHPKLRERLGINPFISFKSQIKAVFTGKYT